jgi:hypothetical protein
MAGEGCQWEALTVDMEDGVWLTSGRRLVAGDFKVVFSLASDEEKVLRGSGLWRLTDAAMTEAHDEENRVGERLVAVFAERRKELEIGLVSKFGRG